MTLHAWIQDFQTLIAGAIGFAGVIITLVLNARYARQQRREERRHEREALRIALVEELKINREAFVRESKAIGDSVKAGVYQAGVHIAVPSDVMDDAYRTFTHRIGLLSSEEVRKVMFAYLTLRTFHSSLLLIGVPPLTGARYVNVPSEKAQDLLWLQRGVIAPIDEAIRVLERARDAG